MSRKCLVTALAGTTVSRGSSFAAADGFDESPRKR
jgi:hypothetical protein